MAQHRNPFKPTLAASLNLTAASLTVATQMGTAACPVPQTVDPVLMAAYRHCAAVLLLLGRPLNSQIEAGYPKDKAA